MVAACEFCSARLPVETTGDHEMEDEPDVVVEADRDTLADAAKLADSVAFDAGDRRSYRAKDECAGDADVLEGLADDALFEGGDVGGDVGQFGHRWLPLLSEKLIEENWLFGAFLGVFRSAGVAEVAEAHPDEAESTLRVEVDSF